MAFLRIDDDYYWMDGDGICVTNIIEKGIWKMVSSKTGPKLVPVDDFKLSHGKIYGKSLERANHVVQAFEKTDKNRNLGVLFSGGRGLGKTLTTRLIIEQLKNKNPIIIISEYIPGMADFLSHIKDAVILMDEFEKFMKGNINGDKQSDEQTKQESILSVLDGNTGCSGNLFLLTVNNIRQLNENLISRPGRIRYHFAYNSEDASVVRAYCQDNLIDKAKIEDVVNVLGSSKFVSMDIISSFVDELNKFPEESASSLMNYFNIEANYSEVLYNILIRTPDGDFTYSYSSSRRDITDEWFYIKKQDYDKLLKIKKIQPGSEEEYELKYLKSICVTIIDKPTVFSHGISVIDKDSIIITAINVNDEDDLNYDPDEFKILSFVAIDPEFKIFEKKYNKMNSI